MINSSLLVLILKKKELRKDFTLCVINRTLVDTSLCLQIFIFQPIGVNNWIDQKVWCMIADGFAVSLFLIMIVLEPILAYNRYIAICRKNRYQRIFRKRHICAISAAVWVLGALFTAVQGYLGSLGKVPGFFAT